MMITNSKHDINKLFSSFHNKVNNLVNKHTPLKTVSRRRAKVLGKPWITKGLRKSIRIKNRLMFSGNEYKYKYYSNKILNLTRIRKQLYYQRYFENNLRNIRKTWEGINILIHWKSKKQKRIHKIKHLESNGTTSNAAKISNILNKHFASVGHKLASQLPCSSCHFTDYYHHITYSKSFFFAPVTPADLNSK